jgi:hypothetical protein
MNIVTDTPIKIKFINQLNGPIHEDYLLQGRSILTGRDFSKETIDIKQIDYQIDQNEIKYFKKNKHHVNSLLTNDPAITLTSEHFFIARGLCVDVQDVFYRREDTLFAAYRKKLLLFLKYQYCRNRYSEKIHSNITSITDGSILLQYLPFNTFYRENNTSRAYNYIHSIRVKLYNLLYPGLQEFIELYDREYDWITECFKTFNIEGLRFADFNSANESVMQPMRTHWKQLIFQTYEKASELLKEEQESAIKFDDKESLREIDSIQSELKNTVSNLNLENYRTPNELLKFWPDILAPGPSLLFPY